MYSLLRNASATMETMWVLKITQNKTQFIVITSSMSRKDSGILSDYMPSPVWSFLLLLISQSHAIGIKDTTLLRSVTKYSYTVILFVITRKALRLSSIAFKNAQIIPPPPPHPPGAHHPIQQGLAECMNSTHECTFRRRQFQGYLHSPRRLPGPISNVSRH